MITFHAYICSLAVYLYYIFIMAPPQSSQCMEELQILLQCIDRLGVLVAEQKLEGSAVYCTFLGIELDTTLLPHKLRKLKQLHGSIVTTKKSMLNKGLTITNRKIATCVQGGPPRKNFSPKNV